jgi:hypothetical protein
LQESEGKALVEDLSTELVVPTFDAEEKQEEVDGDGTRPKRPPKTVTWDRCYDFLNFFAEKFGEENGVFYSKQS